MKDNETKDKEHILETIEDIKKYATIIEDEIKHDRFIGFGDFGDLLCRVGELEVCLNQKINPDPDETKIKKNRLCQCYGDEYEQDTEPLYDKEDLD